MKEDGGPSADRKPGLALGRFTHLGGTFDAVFLCIGGADAAPVRNTWYDSVSTLPCDPGPDTQTPAECQVTGTTGQQPCTGRNWYTFSVQNTAKAVMPRFEVPATGVTWALYAWIVPPGYSGTAGVTTASGRLARFAGYGLSFSYPRGWHSLVPRQASDGIGAPGTLVFEGTAPLRDSCPVSGSGGGIQAGGFPCGQAPVQMLSPGGLLISWTASVDATSLAGAPGVSETVAGRPARVFSGSARPSSASIAPAMSVEASGVPASPRNGPSCSQIGGDQMVEAAISLGPGSIDQMIACIRAPRISQSMAEVSGMLTSLRLA